jgi:hypothetical protein
MSKSKKLYNLRARISIESEQVCTILKYLIDFGENPLDTNILAEIALEKSKNISKLNEKIGIILKH